MLVVTQTLGDVRSLERGLFGNRRRFGLGFTMWDLLDASGRESCDPKDISCNMRNAERSNAVQDLWYSTYQKDPNTANLPTPSIHVNLDSSDAMLQRFKDNQPLTTESISVGSGPAYTVAQLETAGTFYATPPARPPQSAPSRLSPGSVVVFNVTRPGQRGFQPGDAYKVEITGASPNQPVTAAATHNGQSLGSSSFGSTDSSGHWSTTGTMSVDEIGDWMETWYVAGVESGTASFSVLQSPGPTGTQSKIPPDLTAGNQTMGLQKNPPAKDGADSPLSGVLSFLTSSVSIAGFDIPVWLLGSGLALAAGVGGGKDR